MPRPPRIQFPGAIYHVMGRGNNGRPLVRTDSDRRAFYQTLSKELMTHGIRLYAHALMTNHYHLLVETPLGNLSLFMRDLARNYVVNFKKRHKHRGYLFQDRFKAILVQRDDYFMKVVRYIHRNPVEAGIVACAEDYDWSSMKDYLAMRPPLTLTPIDQAMVRVFIAGDFRREFLELHAESSPLPIAARARGVSYYGDAKYAAEFISRIERRRKTRFDSRRFTIESLESAVKTALGREVADIIQARHHAMTLWKQRIILLAAERCGMNYSEMGDRWRVQASRLTKLAARYRKDADRIARHLLADAAAG